jgi:hypothetical protein
MIVLYCCFIFAKEHNNGEIPRYIPRKSELLICSSSKGDSSGKRNTRKPEIMEYSDSEDDGTASEDYSDLRLGWKTCIVTKMMKSQSFWPSTSARHQARRRTGALSTSVSGVYGWEIIKSQKRLFFFLGRRWWWKSAPATELASLPAGGKGYRGGEIF